MPVKDTPSTSEDVAFATEGYLLAPPADSAFRELAAKAFQVTERLARESSGIQRKWTHASGKVKHLVNPHRQEAVFRELIESRESQELLRRVFGATPLFVTHSKLSLKFQGSDQAWFPHQDTAYKTRHNRLATVGIFLEEISQANGGLQLFPGSHKDGPRPHELFFAENETDPQIRIKEPPPIVPVTIAGPPGTMLVFDGDMIHQSGENRAGGIRALFLFEVEPLRGFAMEADGQDAIVLNAAAGAVRADWRKPIVRNFRRFFELGLKPLAKKSLFFFHRRVLRRRGVSYSAAKP